MTNEYGLVVNTNIKGTIKIAREVLDYLEQAEYEIVEIETFLDRDNIYICRPNQDMEISHQANQ